MRKKTLHNMRKRLVLALFALSLAGCGGGGSDGLNTLTAMQVEESGANCVTGGVKITSGLDANRNGTLDEGEVAATQFVCGGAAGELGSNGATTLMATSTEAAGANCAEGGFKVTSGVDTNGNGSLDSAEVTATNYVCNAAPNTGMSWENVTGTSQQATANTGYLANNASLVTVTLPANSALSVGDRVAVTGAGAGGWKLAQNAGQIIQGSNIGLFVPGPWTLQTSLTNNVYGLASSSDGTKLVAATPSQIHTSTDGGSTWIPRASGTWTSVASSSDGTQLVATALGGQIYTSSDSGATWNARASIQNWIAVASSSDGSRLVAAVYGGQIYTSTDSGTTWNARASVQNWYAVASSSDGSKLVAAALGGQIYTSSDSGATWNPRASIQYWDSVASSSDGSRLVATVLGGQIYTSSDSGATWIPRASSQDWISVASSSDGSRLVAAVYGGQIYTSTDSGTTWNPGASSQNWYAVASSSDGSKLVAGLYSGEIYIRSAYSNTTTGTGGSLSGGQYSSVELQYLGGGVFLPIASSGALSGN